MRLKLFFLMLLLACAAQTFLPADARAEEIVPRTIIALYNGGDTSNSFISAVAEMPLNHLGLSIEYHDIHEPLPDIAKRKDVRGVITWFYTEPYDDPAAFYQWALAAMEAGKKFVVVGSLGISNTSQQSYLIGSSAARFMGRLGIKSSGHWSGQPVDVSYEYKTPSMFLSPHEYDGVNSPYEILISDGSNANIHLLAHRHGHFGTDDGVLIVTNKNGGYMDADYAIRTKQRGKTEITQWLVNPFEFFRAAYATDDLPKPDVTTLAGRRIYYSNIDGDGWNNVTQLDEYRGRKVLSSEVVLEKAIKPFPNLPVMVAPIAADLDSAWVGSENSREVARQIWALPQVEAGSHTYSHPFDWEFFHKGGAEGEIPLLHLYKTATWKPTSTTISSSATDAALHIEHSVPRAYAKEPFDIQKEIGGSLKALAAYLPQGKKIDIIAWSGDCLPWEEVIRLSRDENIQNINGGDSRFDPEYPAFGSVAPIGRHVGNQLQIYNSTSNENTYTDLWTSNFHAYRYLKKTIDNTNSPIRLSAMSIYYHMYSGEKEASLSALLENLKYANSLSLTPITVNKYTHIAEGFYETQITSLGTDTWRVENRGALQTIRFDNTDLKAVDLDRSKGVVGQQHFETSLYVYLDETVASPVIALKQSTNAEKIYDSYQPYLVESRWPVTNLTREEGGFEFTAQGFGAGEMVWHVPQPGTYRVLIKGNSYKVEADKDLTLQFKLDENALAPLHIAVKRI